MATLKEKLDAASEGRSSRPLSPETLAWLEAERAAIEAGDRDGASLEELTAEVDAEELEASEQKPEARQRERRVPPHR
jgi:hypothetical protein